ncbi:MAG TPA: hypothetical protein VLX56_01415 [Nitrososphaerales archaeon]|nr:hypothetical protein [Nitrososphaerales archaeon]
MSSFDIAAASRGERVHAGATKGMEKALRRQRAMAGALKMKLSVLHVRPELPAFLLESNVESDFGTIHRSEIQEIA